MNTTGLEAEQKLASILRCWKFLQFSGDSKTIWIDVS